MLIITNRSINKSNFNNGIGDHNAFGDEVNSKGPNEVRLAHAKQVEGAWQVRMVKEPSKFTDNNIPSRKVFSEIRNRLTLTGKNCVFLCMASTKALRKILKKR